MPKVPMRCDHCGETFRRFPSQAGPYCSRHCALGSRRNQARARSGVCEQCGNTYVVRFPSKLIGKRFCSNACHGRARLNGNDIEKRCPRCGETQPLEAFRRNKATPSGRAAYCKVCSKGEKQPVPCLRYGMSVEEYERRAEEQLGFCAICFQLPKRPRLAVDHNHATGEVRGLLCERCNAGLGFFRDRADVLARAADYLATNGGAQLSFIDGRITACS